MTVTERCVLDRHFPSEDQDHHPLAREGLGVDAHEAPAVEMTVATLE